MEKGERPTWDSPVQFFMACVSFVVGLGNVWRFPYLCQMHGGGAFLIPYLLMLFLEGMPLFYLELAIGQKMRQGSIGAWSSISPYLGGVGIASVLISLYYCLYYNILNGWSFWYLFHSFQAVLPWSTCPLSANGTQPLEECTLATPTQYFFYRETLNISPNIEYNGGVHTGQALCLTLAWCLTFLFIVKGVKWSGKVMYVTATFPYVVLTIYLIRALTLNGATNGIIYLFTPKMEELANPITWVNAATQIFISLAVGFGPLIAFSSYNQYNYNVERQAVVMSFINSFTSIFSSIVTFAIYGFKATLNYENCLDRVRLLLLNTFSLAEDLISQENMLEWVEKLNSSFPLEFAEIADKVETCDLTKELDTAVEGTGLAYIVYSEAITNMPLPQIWSVLYFFMLLACVRLLPPARAGFTTPSGNYWFTIFNDYGCNFSVFFVVLFELIAVNKFYGLKRYIEDMLGHEPNWYWKIMWGGVSPLLLFAVLIFYIVNYIQGGTPTYQAWNKELGRSVITEYPVFGQAMIGLLIVSSIMCVPVTALYVYCTRRRSGVTERT
uniref:Transporter n=1 Tax=Neogobius melanostomus TaxID=47308 RepID=A0A8C6U8D9_9GOBI